MSKEANIKNQNKLKVYLEKTKNNGINPTKDKINAKKVRSI
jgi:hypothetical protein